MSTDVARAEVGPRAERDVLLIQGASPPREVRARKTVHLSVVLSRWSRTVFVDALLSGYCVWLGGLEFVLSRAEPAKPVLDASAIVIAFDVVEHGSAYLCEVPPFS